MFERILVAVDGSATAQRGLETALTLACDQRAKLFVLHIVDEASLALGFSDTMYVPAQQIDALIEGLRKAGRDILAKAQKAATKADCDVQPVLVETVGRSVADVIVAQARKLRADLIVLGTHGRRGVSRLVMGSDAEAVLRESRVPVLLVRGTHRARSAASRGKAGSPAATTGSRARRATG